MKKYHIIVLSLTATIGLGLPLFNNCAGNNDVEAHNFASTSGNDEAAYAALLDEEGKVLVGGDMIFDKDELPELENGTGQESQGAHESAKWKPFVKWKNGEVQILLPKSSFTPTERELIFDACQTWASAANGRIKCDPVSQLRSGKAPRLEIRRPTQDICRATVGAARASEGGSYMELGPNCWKKGVIIHEFGHVFGLMHEHQRPDRDKYITVLYENIYSDKWQWFDTFYVVAGDILTVGKYDFDSIMHYESTAYSIDGKKAFTLKPPNQNRVIEHVAKRPWLSNGDKESIKKLY